jgi:hypothetical protein
VVRYVLVEWRGDDKDPAKVVFEVDSEKVPLIDKLTNRILATIARILNEAGESDPDGLYVPILPVLNSTGAEFFVLRDGFLELLPVFEGIVQKLLDEYLLRRAKLNGTT